NFTASLGRTNASSVNAGTWTIAANETLSVGGGGQTFTQQAGTLAVSGGFSESSATFALAGGTLAVRSGFSLSSGTFNFTGGAAKIGRAARREWALDIGAGSAGGGKFVMQGKGTASGRVGGEQAVTAEEGAS